MTIREKAGSKNIIIIISRALLSAVKWITRGRVDMRYDERTTTIGKTVYTGTKWLTKTPDEREREIAHEAVHIRQWIEWGPFYAVSYVLNIWSILFPVAVAIFGGAWWLGLIAGVIGSALPAGLSLRAYWEFQAFKATLLKLKEQGQDYGHRDALLCHMTELLEGPAYYYAGKFCWFYIFKKWINFLESNEIGKIE